jgi:hypothetical protein
MCDLGMSPLANSYVGFENSHIAEKSYPLKVWVCESCHLAQLESFESPKNIFEDYLYFSSISSSWVDHARRYSVAMIERFGLGAKSHVVEIASNDGYLLQHFKARGIPVLGIEPAANVAKVAIEERGIPSLIQFFGVDTAEVLASTQQGADLLIGNNVFAHVPNINDFVRGLCIALNPTGVITIEFPHLLQLLSGNQFDTIYHEHFSYLSFLAVERIFASHGLIVFDVEELPTHGGSLRIFACHEVQNDVRYVINQRVDDLRCKEIDFGLERMETYTSFGERVKSTKRKLLKFLIDAREDGKSVVCYGAAAKGVTLVNYCGVREDLVDYVVDKSPHKQNHFMPGVRLPIFAPERIFETKPDYLLILPWNLSREISAEMDGVRDWGGRFVVPIPEVSVLP